MIDDILDALVKEAQAYVNSIADDNLGTGQVMLATNYKSEELVTYGMPLVILAVPDGSDTSLYPGGLKRADWNANFASYHYMPDPTNDDPSGYAPGLMKIVDLITDHFAAGLLQNLWLTQGMRDLFSVYGYQMTLEGIGTADPLGADGLILGWKTNFGSLALFRGTSQSQMSTAPMMTATQVNNPPFT